MCLHIAAASPRKLSLPESVWDGPNIIRIPFTLTGTLITVRGQIDSMEGNFFFDTGASELLLNSRYFGRRSGALAKERGGVTGKVRVLGNEKVDTLRIDNLVADDVYADVISMTHLEYAKKIDLMGIIGQKIFHDYEVLFDYEAALIVLVKTDQNGAPLEALPNWEYLNIGETKLLVEGHVAVVWMRFDGKTERKFAIDSGAEQNLLHNSSGKQFLKNNYEIRKRVKLRGASEKGVEVLSGLLYNARIDTFAWKPMATLLTNLGEINAVYKTYVDGIIGYEFLSQRPVAINYKRKRLVFYEKVAP